MFDFIQNKKQLNFLLWSTLIAFILYLLARFFNFWTHPMFIISFLFFTQTLIYVMFQSVKYLLNYFKVTISEGNSRYIQHLLKKRSFTKWKFLLFFYNLFMVSIYFIGYFLFIAAFSGFFLGTIALKIEISSGILIFILSLFLLEVSILLIVMGFKLIVPVKLICKYIQTEINNSEDATDLNFLLTQYFDRILILNKRKNLLKFFKIYFNTFLLIPVVSIKEKKKWVMSFFSYIKKTDPELIDLLFKMDAKIKKGHPKEYKILESYLISIYGVKSENIFILLKSLNSTYFTKIKSFALDRPESFQKIILSFFLVFLIIILLIKNPDLFESILKGILGKFGIIV